MSNALPRPQAEVNFESNEEIEPIETQPELEQRSAPTWFPRNERREEPEELAEPYRPAPQAPLGAYSSGSRQHEKFGHGFERPAGMAQQVLSRRQGESEARSRAPRPTPHHGGLGKSFVFASLAASLTGGLIGLAAAQFDSLKQTAGEFAVAAAANFQPEPERPMAISAAALANKTVIAKKEVATATLAVADANGALNSMIPLILRAEPGSEGQSLALRISGLPEDAYLTAGTRTADNSWLLTPGQEQNVKLVVPKSNTPRFGVEVAAIETATGELAAPAKELTVAIDDPNLLVEPANAPPETATIQGGINPKQDGPLLLTADNPAMPVASATSEAAGLLGKGELLLKSGELAAARQFYERAYAQGAVAGALGAGKTYDPVVFAELNVQGINPDPVKALEWYKRAEDQGLVDATSAIEALQALAK